MIALLSLSLLWLGLLSLQLTLGATMILLIRTLTGAEWDFTLKIERLAQKLPYALVLVALHLLFINQIYPWATHPELLKAPQDVWFNKVFFIARSLSYLAVFALALRATRSVKEQVAGPALIALFFASTLATFDWIQSLEPHWSSSIFGVLFLSGGFIGALAFASLTAKPKSFVQGNLFLAGCAVWAYLMLMQVMVLWMGHIPERLEWLTRRAQGVWLPVTIALWTLGFLIPVVILLQRRLKIRHDVLIALSIGVLLTRALEIASWLFAIPGVLKR